MLTPATMPDVCLPQITPATPPATAFEQLMAERKRVEAYTNEQYARLSRLRELIRTEKAAAEADLEARRRDVEAPQAPQEGPWQAECERLHQQMHELQKCLEQVHSERNRFQAALVQLGQQNRYLQQQVLYFEQEAVRAERQRIDNERQQIEEQLQHIKQTDLAERKPAATSAVQLVGAPAPRIIFGCSHCGQRLRASLKKGGNQVRCPNCSNVSSLPG